MIRKLQAGVASIRLRISPQYHSLVVRRYWENTENTHADMSPESFGFYAERIAELLGPAALCGDVLDHGAGDGRIGIKLKDMGYRVSFSEFAQHFIAQIEAAGHRCYAADALPEAGFDTIFVNNAIFYVHPSRLGAEIRRLLSRVRRGGRLLLLDVPTLQREHLLKGNPFVRAVRHLTSVCQPEAGGFFVNEAWIARQFPRTRVTASWANYRAHLELRP